MHPGLSEKVPAGAPRDRAPACGTIIADNLRIGRALLLGYAVTDRLRPAIALVGNTNAFRDADDVRSLAFPVGYWFAGRFRLQGYAAGPTDAITDFSIRASLSIDY